MRISDWSSDVCSSDLSISTFGKLHVWEQPGDRALALCTAGNLALSQAVVTLLRDGFTAEDGKGHDLMQAATMFEAAGLVGSAISEVARRDGEGQKRKGPTLTLLMLIGS